MAIEDDISVDISGNFRWTGGPSTFYTVLEFHRYIGDLMDDAQASGDDLLDITSDTASDRSTDQILRLNAPFNIDDTLARHLYDGSVEQSGGDTLYSGYELVGTVQSGTEPMIIQDDKVLPAWWGTGVNADAANAIIMRILIKSRDGGADIDNQRVRTFAREFGDQYQEFSTTLGFGSSVAAISTGDDLNNATARATVEGWTTIANTEGFQLIDIDNDGTPEEYYAQFDIGSQSINDTYEWSKLQTARSLITLNGTDTGSNFIVDNGTIVGQAQSFTSRAVAEKLTEARFRIRIAAGAPTGPLHAELYATTTGVIPTGAVLATSEPVLSSLITATYQEIIFRFNDNVTMTASTQYAIVIRHPDGTAGANYEVEGSLAGGTVAGENNANENPAATWNAVAAADLWFTVKACPVWHSRPGEKFRGITHEIVYDNEMTGPFVEDEIVYWGTRITYDGLANGPFNVGQYVQFQPSGGGTVKNGGKILADSGTILTVALENITANLLDNDIITEIESGTATTANINVTITDQNRAGGEGVLLALDDNGVDGDLYIQLISGSAPVDNLQVVGRTSGATADVNVTVTSRTISPTFIGVSTGTNIIGAYGIGFQTTDVGASDLLFDLTNTPRTPPNNVTFTVTGLVPGEDRLLVGPRSGSALVKNQFTTDTALTGAAETVVSIATVAIPTDTPGAGEGTTLNTRIRVQLDSGIYRRQPYASYTSGTPGDFTLSLPDTGAIAQSVDQPSGEFRRAAGSYLDDGFEPGVRFVSSSFTNAGNNATWTAATVTAGALAVVNSTGMVTEGAGTDERLLASGWDYTTDNAASGNEVFIAYIDVLADATSESYTAVYNADRDILIRARDGGATPIKTSEVVAVFGSSNASAAITRITDA